MAKSTKKASGTAATHAAPAAAADTSESAAPRGRAKLPKMGRQRESVSIGNRTYVAGNKRDEADLLGVLTPEQAAFHLERGTFAPAGEDEE